MDKKRISAQAFFADFEDLLTDGRQATFTVTGMSMWPLICHNRDRVIVRAPELSALKKGDIVLVRVTDSRYLLHRITHIKGHLIETTGDGNLFRDGYFPKSSVIAVVTKIIRKGREIDCYAGRWKLFARIWMTLFPIRRILLAILRRLHKFLPQN